ncbi:MAG: histidine phosphatase family protein [Synergistaceae bacterium]|jgi:probable phosphoglycerate mutase|nr:histidine phosphatase family protein [Synergistaceae bacterium]
MRFFIIRHGETSWNVEGRFQGQRDTELSEHGLAQGDKVAAFLAPHRFEAVVSSPLKRALVTGKKIAAACGVSTVEIVSEFSEIHHGEWETLLATEVASRWPDLYAAWHTSPHTVIMPGEGGESLRDVQVRSVAAMEKIALKYSGDVCLTTHDAVVKTLLCYFLEAPLSSFWCFQITNCGLTVVELKEGHSPRMSLMGDAHYLDGDSFALPEQKGL